MRNSHKAYDKSLERLEANLQIVLLADTAEDWGKVSTSETRD